MADENKTHKRKKEAKMKNKRKNMEEENKTYKRKKVAETNNPCVFMDISVFGKDVGRMIFELFEDVAPATVENFRALCTGEKGIGKIHDLPLHYKGSFFYDIEKGSSYVKGGDLYGPLGKCGESIYGAEFPNEKPQLEHNKRGLLSMSICDRYGLGSHFMITLKPDHDLDRFHLVFGKLIKGFHTLDRIENGHIVRVFDCGEYDGRETGKEHKRGDHCQKKQCVKNARDLAAARLEDSRYEY